MAGDSHLHQQKYLHPKATLDKTIEVNINTEQNLETKNAPPWTSVKFVISGNVLEYPSGTKIMPWWVRVLRDASTVDSCPPPNVPVETNTLAYFPASPPDIQRPPVASQNACGLVLAIVTKKYIPLVTYLPLAGEITVSRGDTKNERVIRSKVLGGYDRVLGFSWSVHLG
jgi:hypothetical protein